MVQSSLALATDSFEMGRAVSFNANQRLLVALTGGTDPRGDLV